LLISRPGDLPNKDWPWQVGTPIAIGHRSPLVPEQWKITIDSVDRTHGIAFFEANGSVTGFDGRGSTEQPFVSRSGRVQIEPENWWTHDVHGHYLLEPGHTIQWQVSPISTDSWSPSGKGQSITVADGLPNILHVLHIHSGETPLPIASVVIQRPRFANTDLLWMSVVPPYAWQRIWWMHLPSTESRHYLSLPLLILVFGSLASVVIILVMRKTIASRIHPVSQG
jgi:hypothetical protein